MTFRGLGYIYAALSAALYGTNPIFAVSLYDAGMNVVSVLLFRYILGIPLLAGIIVGRSERLLPHRNEIFPLAFLGVMMGISSLGLYESYKYMNPGVASTLLFMYPVFTAMLMILFFHEKLRPTLVICLLIMGTGLYFLMKPGELGSFSIVGFALIFISSLTYAIYLVVIKISKILPFIPVMRSLLYQLLFGCLVFIAPLVAGMELTAPAKLAEWINLIALAILPTVLSLIFTIKAIKCIGPTPTAIFGALEPITAVVLTYLVLGESITLQEMIGGMLILAATLLVVAADGTNGLIAKFMRKVKQRI